MPLGRHAPLRLVLLPLILAVGACSTGGVNERVGGDLLVRSDDGNELELLRNPTVTGRLTSGFGYRWHPIIGQRRAHRGIDLAAPTGTPVRAAESGVLLFQGDRGSFGNLSTIKHGTRVVTAYAHLDRFELGLVPGMRVEKGQVIGYVGTSGRSSGPHLHYEVVLNGRRVDPLGGSRLQVAGDRDRSAGDARGQLLASLGEAEPLRSE